MIDHEQLRDRLRTELSPVEASPRLHRSVAERTRRSHRGNRRAIVVLTAATVSLVAVVAIVIGPGRPAQRETQQAAADPAFASVPKPTNVHITKPSPGLPARIAAFSGAWEGRWDGQLPSRLIVEKISKTSAQVVYAYGTAGLITRPGWMRLIARVQPSGVLTWGGPVMPALVSRTCGPAAKRCKMLWSFTISSDGSRIAARREVSSDQSDYVNLATMRPAGAQHAKSTRGVLIAVIALCAAALCVGAGVLIGRRRT